MERGFYTMKIAMLTRWNATCGISMHAELVAKEWIKNHDLTVFAPTSESARDWHHQIVEKPDEDYVIRGYEQPTTLSESGWIDDRLWKEDYDILIVQGLALMPIQTLLKIWKKIKAKKILVVHEGKLPTYEGFYKCEFDSIVCFDNRYKSMLLRRYPPDKIHIIPYPCHPVVKSNNVPARKKSSISKEKIILFSFGRQPLEEYRDYLKVINELKGRYEVKYVVLRSDHKWNQKELPGFLDLKMGAPPTEKIYEYLQVADIHLIPKSPTDSVVVSSTVFQCLGALTPIVVPNTKHFELLEREVVKYNNREELREGIIKLITDEDFRENVLNSAEKYVNNNSSEKVAEMFIKLFRDIKYKYVIK